MVLNGFEESLSNAYYTEVHKTRDLFANVSKLTERKDGYVTPEEANAWHEKRVVDGMKRFKRRVLGFLGKSSVKSLDEMGQLFCDVGLVSSIEEGRKRTFMLTGSAAKSLHLRYTPGKLLNFERVQGPRGDEKYRISIVSYGYPVMTD